MSADADQVAERDAQNCREQERDNIEPGMNPVSADETDGYANRGADRGESKRECVAGILFRTRIGSGGIELTVRRGVSRVGCFDNAGRLGFLRPRADFLQSSA